MNKLHSVLSLLLLSVLVACSNIVPPTYTGPPRSFETSFESLSDFYGFYIVPPGDYASSHELSSDLVRTGQYAHKAWILAPRAGNNDGLKYLPHRAYPTVQFQKTPDGIYRTPCLVTLWVNLDMALVDMPAGSIDDWFSFATLTPDSSDSWSRTVCVNIAVDGYVRLVHVPSQGEQKYIYQVDPSNDPTGVLLFPYRQWVRLDIYIDYDKSNGYAKVWQNGMLISHALVKGGVGGLAQAHFGLYASAAIPSGTIYNDDLRIKEVSGEAEAMSLIEAPYPGESH
jgi:hypothetical protein